MKTICLEFRYQEVMYLSTNHLGEQFFFQFSIIYKAILSVKFIEKTILKFEEDLIKKFTHLIINQPIINLGDKE